MRNLIILDNEDIKQIQNNQEIVVMFPNYGQFHVMSEECFEKQKKNGLEIIEKWANSK